MWTKTADEILDSLDQFVAFLPAAGCTAHSTSVPPDRSPTWTVSWRRATAVASGRRCPGCPAGARSRNWTESAVVGETEDAQVNGGAET